MKINFLILTWGEDLDRAQNFKFCLIRLKKLCNFLNLNNIQTVVYPFCFGKFKLTEDSYHSDLSALTYHKSFKTNYAIKQIIKNNDTGDLLCYIDADIFVLEQNFLNLMNYLKNTNFKEKYLTSRWLDTDSREDFDFEKNTIKNDLKINQVRGSDASGLFIVDFNILLKIGGFDERYTVWGAEDDDMCGRLERFGLEKEYMDFHPIHIKHKRLDTADPNSPVNHHEKIYYLNQVKICQQDKSITRATILNNYYLE
jgi:GT2 family glycosyltransferase